MNLRQKPCHNMKYLSNSPFYGLLPAEDLPARATSMLRELADLPECLILIEFSDREQDRSLLPEICVQLLSYPQLSWFILAGSDRNLASFRDFTSEQLRVGVYIPTDELIYKCPYLQRSLNFGAQLDLLRRAFIVLGHTFVVCDPSAIRDPDHYLEMISSLTQDLFPIRYAPGYDDFLAKFNLIKRA